MKKIIFFCIFLWGFFLLSKQVLAQATATCTADFNNDSKVNILDYTILSSNFMKKPLLNPQTDLTGDGKADLADFTVLINSFSKNCSTVQVSPSPSVSPLASPSPSVSPITTSQSVIRVLSISYIPLLNGKLDTTNHIKDTYGEYNFTATEVRQRISNIQSSLITMLVKGSKYHGYKDANAPAFLNYQIVQTTEHEAPVPLSDKTYNSLPLPDYMKMMNDHNICDYVDNQGVKEVWLWTYAGTGKSGWESNFSSPNFPDISNSNKDATDLPICKSSYTVYDYNYGRTVSEAVEDHIHQYEALFKFVDFDLFWTKFVGYFPGGSWSTATASDKNRRCGWAHFPPNGQKDYDWTNASSQASDCENWDPNSLGATAEINCQKWNCNSTDYFVWWMQNIPGQNNGIIYQNKPLRNWWEIVADFDKAMSTNKSFFKN